MNFKIEVTPYFEKNVKKLAKKYRSLKSDIANLITQLETEPEQGTPLGKNCYKIRLSIKSKGKGKSGGARIITNLHIQETTVYLLSIYDKSDKKNLSPNELDELLEWVIE